MHNELLCAQETIRILGKEISEKESEVIIDSLIVYLQGFINHSCIGFTTVKV